MKLLIACVFAMLPLGGWGSVTATALCTGGAADIPQNIFWKKSTCVAASSSGFGELPGTVNGLICPGSGQTVYAQWPSGGSILPCGILSVAEVDASSEIANGRIYLNCVDCSRLTPAGGVAGMARVFLAGFTGGANGGCGSFTLDGVDHWGCNAKNVLRCQAAAGASVMWRTCSFSYTREPDMLELVNILTMAWVGFALVAGLTFGWRVAQRGTSQ